MMTIWWLAARSLALRVGGRGKVSVSGGLGRKQGKREHGSFVIKT